jgi:molecular chaperone DnaK
MPQIEVTFDIDANGILNVKAKDKASNKEQSIKIEASSGLSKEEVEKMQKDAELNEAEDKKKRELVDTKNLGEQMAYTAEKALKDGGDKVPADIKTSVEEKIVALRETLTKDSVEEIKKASEALSTEMQKIGEVLNKANAEAQQNANAAGAEAAKDNVKDAEVEEEKKDETK